jgi:hypothetical protein
MYLLYKYVTAQHRDLTEDHAAQQFTPISIIYHVPPIFNGKTGTTEVVPVGFSR